MSTLGVGRHRIELSNEDKVLFPAPGYSKRDLANYYRAVAPAMLRHLARRPLAMQRFPDGIDEEGFYQKQVPGHFPDWIERVKVDTSQGQQVHCLCNDAASLVYLADQACITLHAWQSRADRLHRPDRLVLDLDPERDDFQLVVQAARAVRGLLEEIGLAVFVQTTGSRGVHVVAPIRRCHDFDEVRAIATNVARLLTSRHPDDLTLEQRKQDRGGRLYLDIGRNAYGQTAVAPYAVRARQDAPVAAPLAWDELGTRVRSSQAFTLSSMPEQLATRGDPWKGMGHHARMLREPWKRLRSLLRDEGVDADFR